MSNLTDAIIAAKLVGGSGGSGGGSGLPEIRTETTTILAEQSVAFSKDQGGMYIAGVSGQYPINVGDSITVNWDGTTYECIVGEMMGYTMWGNLAIAGGSPDTGEPFCMVTGEEGMEMYAASGESHTVELISTTYNPPAGSILIVENGEWAEKSIEDCLPTLPSVKRIGGYINSTVTIAANAGATLSFTANDSVSGHYEFLHGFIANGENDVRPLIFGYGGLNNGVIRITAHNASSSSITLTSGQAYLDAWYVKMDEA